MTGPAMQFTVSIVFQDSLFLQQNTFLEQVIFNLGRIILNNVSKTRGISKHNFMHFWAGDQLLWNKLVPLVF